MKKKIIILFTALVFAFSGCGQPSNSTIEKDIEAHVLSNEHSPSGIELVLLTSFDGNICCSIHTSWAESTSMFLTECFYAIPIIKETLNTYGHDSVEIDITSKNDSEGIRSLTYKSDNDIFVLDSSGSSVITQRYIYEQLYMENDLQTNSSNKVLKSSIIESGSYNICGEVFHFSNSVKNDVTGNWRISLISSSKDATEYAIDYYNTLFSSDNEIHAIVNFTSNTTTRILVPQSGVLNVSIFEYTDNEEHDAKLLFGSMLLKEYLINIETKEIDEIQ